MMTIYNILEELAKDNSRTYKEAILQREFDNQLLKDVFVAALNPRFKYYIRKIPEYTPTGVNNLATALCYLDVFKNRTVTGNAAIELLYHILSSLNQEDAVVFERVIGGDLKCGVSDSTVNKIWKNLIPTTPYCRCSLLKDLKNPKDLERGYYSQLKLDGSYININHNHDNTIEIFTRNGNVYNNDYFKGIVTELQMHQTFRGRQLHGECLVKQDGVLLDRKTGNGILNSVLKEGTLEDNQEIVVIVWDSIPVENAIPKGKYAVPYKDRLNFLESSLVGFNNIKVVEYKIVHSIEEAIAHYKELLADNQEGTVLKSPDMTWKDGTSKEQYKLKVDLDVDLEVVGYNKGNGKNAKTFGSIQCKTSDGLLSVNVSGFEDKEREEIWKNKDKYIGTVMTVKSTSVITDINDEYSLFHPRFVEFRTDKTVADSLPRVIEQFENLLKGE